MKQLAALVLSPITYVVGFAVFGAVSIAVGVGIEIGFGWGLAVLGIFLLAGSAYITKGLPDHG